MGSASRGAPQWRVGFASLRMGEQCPVVVGAAVFPPGQRLSGGWMPNEAGGAGGERGLVVRRQFLPQGLPNSSALQTSDQQVFLPRRLVWTET